MKWLRAFAAPCALGALLAGAAYARECQDDPDLVGQCFSVHGRLHGTASGRIELAPVGRDPLRGRVFAVLYGPDPYPGRSEAVWMPETLQRLEPDFYAPHSPTIYGDFLICRLEPDRPGHMRAVCVQSAEHFIVVKY
jgi:hypothetical protein